MDGLTPIHWPTYASIDMRNLFARAARRLAESQTRFCSLQVCYVRGSSSVSVDATIGKTELDIDTGDGLITQYESRDFLIPREQLALDNIQTEPAAGDQIIEPMEGTDGLRYEVSAPPGRRQAWSWADDFRLR